jgi:hypothetical protein
MLPTEADSYPYCSFLPHTLEGREGCMARRTRTLSDVEKSFSPSDLEIAAAVCDFFCRGLTPSEIREEIAAKFHRELSREQPYQLLTLAASKGWFKFMPPLQYSLAEQIRETYPWLSGVEVVQAPTLEPVAQKAARTLFELIRKKAHAKPKQPIHVGLAGGWTVLRIAKEFGALLRKPTDDFPKKLVFHAMVTGLQLHDPRTDPNTFYTHFSDELKRKRDPDKVDARPRVDIEFVALGAPAEGSKVDEMNGQERGEYSEDDPRREAFERKHEIDIILTSGSSWMDSDHSQLKKVMSDRDQVRCDALMEDGCVADMLWQPLTKHKPIPNHARFRPVTLLDLEEIPAAIDRGTDVLLALGPCGYCDAPRGDVLDTVLNLEKRIITHLVVDSRSADWQAKQMAKAS